MRIHAATRLLARSERVRGDSRSATWLRGIALVLASAFPACGPVGTGPSPVISASITELEVTPNPVVAGAVVTIGFRLSLNGDSDPRVSWTADVSEELGHSPRGSLALAGSERSGASIGGIAESGEHLTILYRTAVPASATLNIEASPYGCISNGYGASCGHCCSTYATIRVSVLPTS
jgi:hypothetical protein